MNKENRPEIPEINKEPRLEEVTETSSGDEVLADPDGYDRWHDDNDEETNRPSVH